MDIVIELKDAYAFLGDPLHRKAYDEIERLRLALHTISSVDADVIVPERMWSEMTPLDCYEEGLMNGAMAVRDAVKTEAYAVLALGEDE
jgi:hypothetical protein